MNDFSFDDNVDDINLLVQYLEDVADAPNEHFDSNPHIDCLISALVKHLAKNSDKLDITKSKHSIEEILEIENQLHNVANDSGKSDSQIMTDMISLLQNHVKSDNDIYNN